MLPSPAFHVGPASREDGRRTHRRRSSHTCLKHHLNGCHSYTRAFTPQQPAHLPRPVSPLPLCLTFADPDSNTGSCSPGLSLCLWSPPPSPSWPCEPPPAGHESPLWTLVAWAHLPAAAVLGTPPRFECKRQSVQHANLDYLLTRPRGKKLFCHGTQGHADQPGRQVNAAQGAGKALRVVLCGPRTTWGRLRADPPSQPSCLPSAGLWPRLQQHPCSLILDV